MYVGLKTFLDNMGAFENANANDKKKRYVFPKHHHTQSSIYPIIGSTTWCAHKHILVR